MYTQSTSPHAATNSPRFGVEGVITKPAERRQRLAKERCCSEESQQTGLTDGMGLRPTQPIGTKDAKQTAEIYARISQETFDQVRRGRR